MPNSPPPQPRRAVSLVAHPVAKSRAGIAAVLMLFSVALPGCVGDDGLSSRDTLIAGKKWSEISASELERAIVAGKADPNRRILVDNPVTETADVPTFPLIAAVRDRRMEHARVLIKHGADVNATDYSLEISPLIMAVESGRWELVEMLINAGADANQPDWQGVSPLFYATRGRALYGRKDDFLRTMDFLVAGGADINAVNARGMDLIHDSMFFGCVDLLPKLIDAGADVNAAIDPGRENSATALMFAAYYAPGAVSLLVDAGADVNASQPVGHTALMSAQLGVRPAEVAKLLIDKGANVNKAMLGHVTALDFAAQRAGGRLNLYNSYAQLSELLKLREKKFPSCNNNKAPFPATFDDWKASGVKAESVLRKEGAVDIEPLKPGRADNAAAAVSEFLRANFGVPSGDE